MATTRSLLRSASDLLADPGKVLEKTNEQLIPDIPSKMFVTCLCLMLEPLSGKITVANAGHVLPYLTSSEGVSEQRASGMPFGLMPGMGYRDVVFTLEPGESLLLLSDGLVEGHNSRREMFGFDRIKKVLAETDPF